MATRLLTILAKDSAGAPQGSLSPVFSAYLVDGATPGTVPTISAVAGATGLYEFTATLLSGERLQAVVDLTASCTGERYLAIATDFDELFAVEAVGTDLSNTHGSGQWGGSAGSGAQACTLTITVGSVARQGARVDVLSGTTVVAQGFTDSSGQVVVNLDAGTYVARVFDPGAQWPSTTVVVTATDTITPSTIDGAEIASDVTAPVGLSGSVSATAPDYAGTIGPLASGDTWTITRTITGLSANVLTAAFAVRRKDDSPGASLFTATATVTDAPAPTGTVSIAIAAGALDLSAGRYRYELRLNLVGGSVVRPEIGDFIVTDRVSA